MAMNRIIITWCDRKIDVLKFHLLAIQGHVDQETNRATGQVLKPKEAHEISGVSDLNLYEMINYGIPPKLHVLFY